MLPYLVAAGRMNYVKIIVWFLDVRTKFDAVPEDEIEAGEL